MTPTTPTATLWTLQVLLAAVYAFSAFGKLTADAQNVAGFEAMGLGMPGMYIVGALELLAQSRWSSHASPGWPHCASSR